MADDKPKNYYTLNLTEGRIFIIFISIIIFLVIIIFGSVVLLSKNRNKDLKLSETELTKESDLFDDDFSFYSDLSDSPDLEEEKINLVKQSVEELSDIIEDNEEDKKEDNFVVLDNSGILYSSMYREKETVKKPIIMKKTPKKVAKTTPKKKEYYKRYIIQIGSYLDKKIAEDISLYYKMQGYPAYIKSKNKSGKLYHRLRIGPFKEKIRADDYLSALKKSRYGKDCYISIVYL